MRVGYQFDTHFYNKKLPQFTFNCVNFVIVNDIHLHEGTDHVIFGTGRRAAHVVFEVTMVAAGTALAGAGITQG